MNAGGPGTAGGTMPGAAPQGLLVLGMHRSGTSAATRLVNLLGLSMCEPDDLFRDDDANAKGYWESRSMCDFNDRLLQQMGRNWWLPPRSGEAYQLDAARVTVPEAEGREAFDRAYHRTPWVWKDPRTCATLPYWRGALGRPAAALVVFRNPLEVGESLLRRSHMAVPVGVAMWERYNRLILEHARGLPTYVTRYQDLVDDPHRWCENVAGFLRDTGLSHDAEVDPAAVDDFVDDGLRHSHRGRHEVRDDFASVVPVLDLLEDAVGCWPSFEPPELPAELGWVEAELVALGAAQAGPLPSPMTLTVSCVFDGLGLPPEVVSSSLDTYARPYEERIVVTDRQEVARDLEPPENTRIVTVPAGTSPAAARAAGAGQATAGIVEFSRLGSFAVGSWAAEMRRAFAAGFAAVSLAPQPSDLPHAVTEVDGPRSRRFAVDRSQLGPDGAGAGEVAPGEMAAYFRSCGQRWAEATGVFEVDGAPVAVPGDQAGSEGPPSAGPVPGPPRRA